MFPFFSMCTCTVSKFRYLKRNHRKEINPQSPLAVWNHGSGKDSKGDCSISTPLFPSFHTFLLKYSINKSLLFIRIKIIKSSVSVIQPPCPWCPAWCFHLLCWTAPLWEWCRSTPGCPQYCNNNQVYRHFTPVHWIKQNAHSCLYLTIQYVGRIVFSEETYCCKTGFHQVFGFMLEGL